VSKNNDLEKVFNDHVFVAPGVKFDIVFSEDLKNLGECYVDSHEIFINSKQDFEEIIKTYIHEILHGMDFYNPPLRKNSKKRRKNNHYFKHEDIYRMEQIIFQFLKLNGFLK